jgi:hypothetical protein
MRYPHYTATQCMLLMPSSLGYEWHSRDAESKPRNADVPRTARIVLEGASCPSPLPVVVCSKTKIAPC